MIIWEIFLGKSGFFEVYANELLVGLYHFLSDAKRDFPRAEVYVGDI